MRFNYKITNILTGCLLSANALFAFNRQDTLRGSNGRGRDWWDVQHYKLEFRIDTASRTISGSNTIQFKVLDKERDSMQIDLQEPMILDSALLSDKYKVNFTREGNVYWLDISKVKNRLSSANSITLYYHGKPREAVNPPWDGGFVWTKDSLGNPWVSVACQGLGASSWWPCKDYQGDEPDDVNSVILDCKGFFSSLELISNGIGEVSDPSNVLSPIDRSDGSAISERRALYFIKNPINTYNVTFYLGDYSSWTDTFQGKKGILDINYCPLKYHQAQAKEHFKQVKKMLEAFEYWFGPYPFYEDGYKIVEAPFLGMEHQSAIAYGNKYKMGYLGRDRSKTGVGLLFDYIIVHESGHEWFGNSITAVDIADNWIHEGFTTYSETLFTEYWFGKEKAFEYTRGEWANIDNDRPVIGNYGVNDDGSGDKYDKASGMIHTIRLLMNDDEKFRVMLHKMNDTFYHKQITTKQMEDFIIGFSGLQLQPIFEQYLRTTMIPELQYKQKGSSVEYRWANVVEGFELPIPAAMYNEKKILKVSAQWQKAYWKKSISDIVFPPTFLHTTKMIH
jgi:aminopeptidase N